MKRRGISGVVVTVLIILLSLGALLILWSFVSPLFSSSGESVSATAACSKLDLRINGCSFVLEEGVSQNVDVKLRRYVTSQSDVEVTNVKFVFNLNKGDIVVVDDASSLVIPDLYESADTKGISLTDVKYTAGDNNVSKVSIVPVITLTSGETEKDCVPPVPFVCKDMTGVTSEDPLVG